MTDKPDSFPDTPDYTDLAQAAGRTSPAKVKDLVREIQLLVQQRLGAHITLTALTMVIEAFVEGMFRETARCGSFRLPYGWGMVQLRWIRGSATSRKVPGIGEIPNVDRPVIRYAEGIRTKSLLGKLNDSDYVRKRPRTSYFDGE